MPFSQRNIFYLRTSAHVVLQTILYLDPRDLKWMNSNAHTDEQYAAQDNDDADEGFEVYERGSSTGDLIWSRALSKLKNKIMPKLVAESKEGEYLSSTNKKEKVDVHIEPDFQMAYFFRKVSGKHAVLLKEKELKFPEAAYGIAKTTAPLDTSMAPPPVPASAFNKSSAKDSMPVSRLAARKSNRFDNVISQGSQIENQDFIDGQEEEVKPANKKRSRNQVDEDDMEAFIPASMTQSITQPVTVKEEDEDVQFLDDRMEETEVEPTQAEAIDLDALQDDKKPRLHVNYSGFKIFGKCFIIVIEPTKRTKRLRPTLFQTSTVKEKHQLSATPVPRQSRETPIPSALRRESSSRRSNSLAQDDEEQFELERQDSRKARLTGGLFRGTSSDWTPTPTPEPSERRNEQRLQNEPADVSTEVDDSTDGDESHSVMLATQMLESGIAGQGNDIDDD